MERELATRLRGVVDRYGSITAANGLNLDVTVGTCVGLLGPNGAGKSTTMRLLTAQSIADGGEIEVLGYQLPDESKQARAQLGVTPQLDNLDVTLAVEQNLLVLAHLYRIPRADRHDAIERALKMASSSTVVSPASTSSRAGFPIEASAGPPTSRTCSSCSRGRKSADGGRRSSTLAARSSRTQCAHRRSRPRAR